MTVLLVVAGLLALLGLWVVLTNNSFIRARKLGHNHSGIPRKETPAKWS